MFVCFNSLNWEDLSGGYHQSQLGKQTHSRESFLWALAFLGRQPGRKGKINNLLRKGFSEKLIEAVGRAVTTHLQYFSGLGKRLFFYIGGGGLNKVRKSHVWGDKVADQVVAHGEAHMAAYYQREGWEMKLKGSELKTVQECVIGQNLFWLISGNKLHNQSFTSP